MVIWWCKGTFPMEEVIEKFSKSGSPYIGHLNNKTAGIEMNLLVLSATDFRSGVKWRWQGKNG